MKLITLALRNIKQNRKKYIMYFFSMSFSVFTTYTFLALMQNEYVKMAFKYDTRYKSLLTGFGIIILVFVLFFLISSNNSFIRARKKELSTYSLFGMTNGMIGKLLFIETMLVGMGALSIGITVGIFFSKLMAMLLLELSLSNFVGDISFSIDIWSIYITDLIFLSIFCVMGLSGLRVIKKFELVDLFKADKVSEGRSKGSTAVLILSLLLIGAGYFLASVRKTEIVVLASIPILILVIIGTYLFFWGGLPKVLSIVKRDKKTYYQGVNLISASAFSHRMKSIASVMATIAVLSAVATTAIATGFTLYSNTEKNTYGITGYDMYFYGGEKELLENIHDVFEKNNVKVTEEYTATLYRAAPKMNTVLIGGYEHISAEKDYFRVYSQSDYNKLVSISKGNLKSVRIKSGEGLYIYPYSTEDIENAMTGQLLTFSDKTISITAVLRSGIPAFGAVHTLVINDDEFKALYGSGDVLSAGNNGKSYQKVTVFNYENSLESEKLDSEIRNLLYGNAAGYKTAYGLYNESLESFGLICFIGFFMSAVFILMTASLLYFKQVMAAEEEKHQYFMLRKIGMDSQTEKKIIVRRLLPVFLIPLVVGISHSIFAMKTADTLVFSNIISAGNSYFAVLAFSSVMYGIYALVYGIFYLITKGQYSRIVR